MSYSCYTGAFSARKHFASQVLESVICDPLVFQAEAEREMRTDDLTPCNCQINHISHTEPCVLTAVLRELSSYRVTKS